MKNKKTYKGSIFNFVLYCAVSVVGMIFLAGIGKGVFNALDGQASLLSLFNRIGLTDFNEGRPDVGIEYVYLRKFSDPSVNFNYHRYKATIVVRNYGERLIDGDVLISAGENQKTAFVRNSLNGLSLDKGQTFVFDDYEIFMDGVYNYGKFEFGLNLRNQKEQTLENNKYLIDVYESPARIGTLEVESLNEKGVPSLAYELMSDYEEAFSEFDFEICVSQDPDSIGRDNKKYAETDSETGVYSYYKAVASKDFIVDSSFECKKPDEGKYNIGIDRDYVLYLKAGKLGENDDFFAVSDAVHLPIQKYLSRADFVKFFVEYAGIPLNSDGSLYYKDVPPDSDYAPYVQTMFNLGLLRDTKDFLFEPDAAMSRADILEAVLNYFDIDLKIEDGAPHYYDVPKNHAHYFFAESLYATNRAKILGIYLRPDKSSSSHFLKYLIDDFKKVI